MKKRLRKKLRRGEFQELGFEVRFRAVDDLSDEAFDNVADAFISQAIEANGLICGGGGKMRRIVKQYSDGLQLGQRSRQVRLGHSSMRGIPPHQPTAPDRRSLAVRDEPERRLGLGGKRRPGPR